MVGSDTEGSVNDARVTIDASDGSGSMNAHVRLGNVIRYGAKLLVVSFMAVRVIVDNV